MSVMKAKEIMEIIPHRFPFMFLDTIEELEPGVRAVAKKCVTFNELYFAGHFPGEPVMPGVILIEAMAQTGAVLLLCLPEFQGKTAYMGAVNGAKFKGKVVPGDELIMETEIIKMKGHIGIGRARAFVKEKLVAQAELTFIIGQNHE